MGVGKTILGRLALAALLLGMLSPPEGTRAFAGPVETKPNQTQLQGLSPALLYTPPVVIALDSEWPIADFWTPAPARVFAQSRYSSIPELTLPSDSSSPVFDIGTYDPMWDDALFSEFAAYGGLGRDAQRVAAMRAFGASDATEGVPYGRLTLGHDFLQGQHQLTLGAYGLQASVRPTTISGFGDDSYTDLAADGTWRWVAHPERSTSQAISVHVLILHENESLLASHAIFGTGKADELTILRGGVGYGSGGPFAPAIQYFQITGTSDPLRLGTVDGSPDSKGAVAEMDYAPPRGSMLATERFDLHVALKFIAYSEFDGSSRNASHNDTVLLHLSIGGES